MTKSNVLLLPNFNRPEFLTITLELLEKTGALPDLHIIFSLDYGFRRTLMPVIKAFADKGYSQEILTIPRTNYSTGKQSYALIHGYRHALSHKPDFIYMVEDDIFVSNDFFNWHHKVLADEPKLFCSIATRNNGLKPPMVLALQKYYVAVNYQSLGVCWPAEKLAWALEWFTHDYFRNPAGYVRAQFPNSKIGAMFCEQDGLFNRLVEKFDLGVAYPWYPRAYHAGFTGKNRGIRVVGTPEQKVATVRQIAFSPDAMRQRVLEQGEPIGYYEDSIPTHLELPITERVIRDQNIMAYG